MGCACLLNQARNLLQLRAAGLDVYGVVLRTRPRLARRNSAQYIVHV